MIVRYSRDFETTYEVPDGMAIDGINALLDQGVKVSTRTFQSPTGDHVTVFWIPNADGTIGVVWEHTYTPAMGQFVGAR